MDVIKQIHDICLETDNEWFLNHSFTKIALYDLKSDKNLDKECTCLQDIECEKCSIELERTFDLDELNINKVCCNVYDYEKEEYVKYKWIIPNKINDEIPGFILIKCTGIDIGEEFTHGLEFACVRYKYRKQGILKNMIKCIPNEWNIWLEVNSNDTKNIETIWEKCGFSYYKTIHNKHIIYKRLAF